MLSFSIMESWAFAREFINSFGSKASASARHCPLGSGRSWTRAAAVGRKGSGSVRGGIIIDFGRSSYMLDR